jgi:hypothetical protein
MRSSQMASFNAVTRANSAEADIEAQYLTSKLPKYGFVKTLDGFIEKRRSAMVQAGSVDLTVAPELQKHYVAVLQAQNDLLITHEAKQIEMHSLIQRVIKHQATWEEVYCDYKPKAEAANAALNSAAQVEQKFSTEAAKQGVSFEPSFAKYRETLVDTAYACSASQLNQTTAPAPDVAEDASQYGGGIRTPGDETIQYSDFYVQSRTGRLIPGKKYQFKAVINDAGHHVFIHNPLYPESGLMQLEVTPVLDNQDDMRRILTSNNIDPNIIIASFSQDGIVQIRRVF